MAGGGVGEAMLIGAAVGAGTGGVSSAIQGKDIGQGMLLGGAMGAATGGIGSQLGGATSTALQNASSPALESAVGSAGIESGAGSAIADITAQNAGAGLTGVENTANILGTSNAAPGSQAAILQAQNEGMGLSQLQSNANIMDSITPGTTSPTSSLGQQGLGQGLFPGMTNAQVAGASTTGGISGLLAAGSQPAPYQAPETETYNGPLSQFKMAGPSLSQYNYNPNSFQPSIAPGFAEGGIADLQNQNMYPQSQYQQTAFNMPSQTPISSDVLRSDYDSMPDGYEEVMMARGGIADLGSYSDGGRLLRGPGDGMSDDIPATIAGKQPARLADGEFVVPADVVSHLGNGSTDAGAKTLYSMMDKVRKARTGSKKQGRDINPDKYMPKMASGGIARFAEGNLVVDENGQVGYYDDDYNFVPATYGSVNSTVGTPAASPTGYSASVYNPYYYDRGYYQNQLSQQQKGIADLEAKKPGLQNELAAYHYSTTPADLYDLSNMSDTAKQNSEINSWYQQYLGRNIGQGEGFSRIHDHIRDSPEARAWAEANAPLQNLQSEIAAGQKALAPIQQNVDRLANSSIAYNPYTVANRPSGNDPQFYGNIYKPEYENYTNPGYTLAGESLGEWNNVAGDTQRYVEGLYNTELGRGSDPEGLRNWTRNIQSGAQTPQDVRQGFWGSQEYQGLHQGANLPTQYQPNVNQMAAGQMAAQQQSLANAQEAAMHSRNLINTSVAEGKNQPQEEKKRRGGILDLRRV